MSSKKTENLEKFKEQVSNALNRLGDPQKVKSGQDQLRQLINENGDDEKGFNLILTLLGDKLSSTKKDERREFIKVFPILTEENVKINTFLPKILTVIQSLIIDENSKYFNIIADTFGEIVVNSWKHISNDSDKKLVYDYLVNFCIINMKSDVKANQVSGSLCLSRLIENCPLILSCGNMKTVWEHMCSFLEKLNFSAKSELLDALISLIFAAEGFFKPYATVTLYKILDYLTDSDWIKRKLAVDIVYTLANYCQEEILALKSHIIEFLKVLKSDRIKQVREACLVTLKFLNDNEEVNSFEEAKDNKVKENKSLETVNKSFSNSNVNNNSVISQQEKKMDKPRKQSGTEKKKTARNTVGNNNNNPNNISTTSNKNPFTTHEPKIPKPVVMTPDRKKKREVSRTPDKHSTSIDRIVEKGKSNVKTTTSGNILTEASVKEEKLQNRNSLSRIKQTKKRDENIDKMKSESPIKVKKEATSIFKGPKNPDFFNNIPKENGIQIIVAEKKPKSNSPVDDNSKENDPEEHSLSEANWTKLSDNALKTSDGKPQVLTMNNNLNNESNLNVDSKIEVNEYGSIDNEKKGNQFNSKKDRRSDYLQNSPQFTSLVNGEDSQKAQDKKDFQINEQRSSIEYNNTRSVSSNLLAGRSNENSEILKQMKDMSEKQIILIDTLERLQKSSNEQIGLITQRLSKLENVVYNVLMNKQAFSGTNSVQNLNNFNIENQTISSFSEKKNYDSLNSFQNNEQLYSAFPDDKNFIYPSNPDHLFEQVSNLIKNNNINEAINISLKKESLFLIKVIERTNFYQFRDVKPNLLDEMISKLLNCLTKKEFIPQVTQFLKNLTLIYNFDLRSTVQKNIKDVLTFVLANKTSARMSEEDANDIGVIISFINNKIGESVRVTNNNEIVQNNEVDNCNSNNYVYVKSNRISKK